MKELLKKEFINGHKPFDYCFLALGIILQVIAIVYGFVTGNPDSIITIISGLTGIISVVLCAEGKISFYLFGYVQLLTYVFGVAIPYALWGEVIENVFYFVTMIIGTVIWIKNYKVDGSNEARVTPKRLGAKGWIISIIALIVSFVAFGLVLTKIHIVLPFLEADPTPWFDSITTVAPFIGQIYLMLGYREQWAFWIIEDVLSLIMFIILGNWIMVAQYLFWTINCIYGWVKWSKED